MELCLTCGKRLYFPYDYVKKTKKFCDNNCRKMHKVKDNNTFEIEKRMEGLNPYQRGNFSVEFCKRQLEDNGYYVIQCAKSEIFDLVALNEYETRLIKVIVYFKDIYEQSYEKSLEYFKIIAQDANPELAFFKNNEMVFKRI